MEFRLLGPFEVSHRAQPVRPGRRQERLLLAVLLLAAGHVVSTHRLIELLWPDGAPPGARTALHTYVARLRRALLPYGVRIRNGAGSYHLDLPDGVRVDVDEFRDLAARVGAETDPARQVRLCREALGRWRGELLADLLPDARRQVLHRDLVDLRLSVAERYATRLLDFGEPEAVATELLPLAYDNPARERLTGLVMTALYRCDRRVDALRLHDDATQSMNDLGVAAGTELTVLRGRIDDEDPSLLRPPGPAYQVRFRGQWLPWDVAGHPALEFCNTYAGWGGERRPGGEWLRGYRTLAVWAQYTGLVDERVVTRLLRQAEQAPLAAADVLAEARELRARLYAGLTDAADVAAFAHVARAAEAAARVSSFVRGDDGLGRWRIASSAGLRVPVYAVARSAAELLADARRLTVRACPAVDCGWLFLDATARRRWCSIGTCGRAEHCT